MYSNQFSNVIILFRLIKIQIWFKLTKDSENIPYRHEMIEVAVGGGGQFEGSETDIVQGFVVDAEGLVCVLNQLVD